MLIFKEHYIELLITSCKIIKNKIQINIDSFIIFCWICIFFFFVFWNVIIEILSQHCILRASPSISLFYLHIISILVTFYLFEEQYSLTLRPGKIWFGPIFRLEPEEKIWVWVGVFWPRNKDGVNPYLTRKMMDRVGLTRGSHGSTFFFFPESILLC